MKRTEPEKNYEFFRDFVCITTGLCFVLFVLLPTIGGWLYEIAR